MIALLRTELTKASRRLRTVIVAVLLVALPSLIVVAINAHGNRPAEGDHGEGLFRLADQSGLLVPAAVLSVMSGFLLVVIAGLIAADSVSGDASSGNLRYLLMRPVPRGRLLVAKAAVAGALIWVSTALTAFAALVAGIIVFGAHAVSVPAFGSITAGDLGAVFRLSAGSLLARDVLVTAYVAFGFTALLAIGTLFSTLTDTAASAIAATVAVYIVSEILDSITALGPVRYGFPTHYMDAWHPIFTRNELPGDMIVGVAVQLAYLVVFGTAAIWWFRRKDIRS